MKTTKAGGEDSVDEEGRPINGNLVVVLFWYWAVKTASRKTEKGSGLIRMLRGRAQ